MDKFIRATTIDVPARRGTVAREFGISPAHAYRIRDPLAVYTVKINRAAGVLAIAAAVIGALVAIAEVGYWFSHPQRPGPSAYIALCGLSVLLLAIAHLLRDRE